MSKVKREVAEMIKADPYVRKMLLSWRQEAKCSLGNDTKVVLWFNTLNGDSEGFRALGLTLEGEVVGNRSGGTRDEAMSHLFSALGSNCIQEKSPKMALVPFMENQKCSYNERVSQKIGFLDGAVENVSSRLMWAVNEHSIATTRNSEHPGAKSKQERRKRKMKAPVANVVRDIQHGENVVVLASDASKDSNGKTSFAWVSEEGLHGGGVLNNVTCNNEAEFIAIAQAFVKGFKKNKHDGAVIYSDSQSSVNRYMDHAKRRSNDVDLTNNQRRTVNALRSGVLKIHWIPSHTQHHGAAYRLNRQADYLASFYRTSGTNGFRSTDFARTVQREFESGLAHDHNAMMNHNDPIDNAVALVPEAMAA